MQNISWYLIKPILIVTALITCYSFAHPNNNETVSDTTEQVSLCHTNQKTKSSINNKDKCFNELVKKRKTYHQFIREHNFPFADISRHLYIQQEKRTVIN